MSDNPYQAPRGPDPGKRSNGPSSTFWIVVVVLGTVALGGLGLKFQELVVWMVLSFAAWAGVSLYLLLMGED